MRPRSAWRRALAAGALLAGLLHGPASADKVFVKKGPPLRGAAIRLESGDVLVNRFFSRTPAMTYGVTRVPAADVRRIEEEAVPEEVVRRRHAALADGDARGRVDLARFALGNKARPEAERLLEEALAIAPDDPDALALYGGAAKFAARRRGRIPLDPALRADLVAYLAMEDGAARAREAKRIEAERGFPARPEVVERMWRSAREKKGIREDVPITLRAEKHPGAVFTIFVPEEYDPLVPTPLVLALHGGGVGGKDGKAVVGSGREAVNLYLRSVQSLRWILVCPTALQAPWAAPPNEPFLLSLLEEVLARYNVDLDRVYLTGHSMGGFGTWWFGPRHLDVFAAIAPTAGGGPGGTKALKDAGTGIFVYHSADDPVCPVGPDQAAANALVDMGADVVYLQLEDRGHSFPPEAEAELFSILPVKRLGAAKRSSAWPRSSFDRPPSPEERRDLGDPAAAWSGAPAEAESLKDLLADLARGGGPAEKAAAEIARQRPAGAAKGLGRILRDPKASDDARAWAARALGDLGDPSGAEPLAGVIATARASRLAREAAIALRKLARPESADGLGKALQGWAAEFDRRLQGGRIEYVDFEEVCLAAAEVAEALAVAADPGTAVALVEKHALRGILARPEPVEASARAGQDPRRPRARLAEGIARALATAGAPPGAVPALDAIGAADPAVAEAIATGRASPWPRAAPK